MGRFRAFLSLGLALLVAFVPIKVFADEGEQIRRDVVTEYYSPDLTDPPIFDATETVAPIGTVLEIPAKSCILMEVNTGQILYESESHMKLAPASITKIMALLLVVEAIDSGLLSTETVITASDYACSMGGSQIWLEPGEQMSVNDLLKAAVIGSANDATVALGEAVAGSEEGFVKMGAKGQIKEGLKYLQKVAAEVGDNSINQNMSVADYYQAGYLTEDQAKQAEIALQYIFRALPNNAKALLQPATMVHLDWR